MHAKPELILRCWLRVASQPSDLRLMTSLNHHQL
jgi:hypothetical protein